MGPHKTREARRTTFVRARLRTDQGWSDVTIGNVSARGLMLQSSAPLRRNEFVEVRYHHLSIVGRIVWARGAKCGVRTQDQVDIATLLSHVPAKRREPGKERRAAPRQSSRPQQASTAAARAEASRRTAHMFDWVIVAVGGGAAAALVAQVAYSALDAPLVRIGAALAAG